MPVRVALILLLFGVSLQAADAAQKSGRVYQVGWVHVAAAPPPGGQTTHLGALPPLHVFRARLAQLGYTEGVNVAIHERWAGGDYQRVAEMRRSSCEVESTSSSLAGRRRHASRKRS